MVAAIWPFAICDIINKPCWNAFHKYRVHKTVKRGKTMASVRWEILKRWNAKNVRVQYFMVILLAKIKIPSDFHYFHVWSYAQRSNRTTSGQNNGWLSEIKLTPLIFLMESDTRMAIIVIFLISTYKLTKLEYYDSVWLCHRKRARERKRESEKNANIINTLEARLANEIQSLRLIGTCWHRIEPKSFEEWWWNSTSLNGKQAHIKSL